MLLRQIQIFLAALAEAQARQAAGADGTCHCGQSDQADDGYCRSPDDFCETFAQVDAEDDLKRAGTD